MYATGVSQDKEIRVKFNLFRNISISIFFYFSKTITIYKTLLASNMITPNSEQCVEFYYFQSPSVVGSLNIYAKLNSATISSIGFPIWTEPFLRNTTGTKCLANRSSFSRPHYCKCTISSYFRRIRRSK